MSIQIYNTMTQQKEDFIPIIPNKVSMYVCGVTVYDYCHVGHARMFVVFDVVTRFLRSQGFDVTYVRNITDIDDKIIARAIENNESTESLTQRFIDSFHADCDALNVLPPTHEPLATQTITPMIAMIETLIEKGFAYIADNGDVYYDVQKFDHYGCLSHRDLEGLQAGVRVELVDSKRNPLDFVLWKMAKPNEPSWSSPWGNGRPGWHIECSAMSMQLLGSHFDIHGGGFDLQFPHHENEIAQSCAATGDRFANLWMHIGFLQVNKEKMSKSLNNFFTVREVLEVYPAEIVRYFLLSAHYRTQLNYSTDNLDNAKASLERFYTALRDLHLDDNAELSHNNRDVPYVERFVKAMNDDFNTPEALAILFEMTHEINALKKSHPTQAVQLGMQLKSLGAILGILQQSPEAFFQSGVNEDDVKTIEQLIVDRNIARTQKDWAKADAVRTQLHSMGIEIEDTSSGTIWRRI